MFELLFHSALLQAEISTAALLQRSGGNVSGDDDSPLASEVAR